MIKCHINKDNRSLLTRSLQYSIMNSRCVPCWGDDDRTVKSSALNETRPLAAIAKRRVVFCVMNAELYNMRLSACATFTADMPPDGFSVRRLFARLSNCSFEIVAYAPLSLSLYALSLSLHDLIANFSVYLPREKRLFRFRLAKSSEIPARSRFAFAFYLDAFVRQKPRLLVTVKSCQDCEKKKFIFRFFLLFFSSLFMILCVFNFHRRLFFARASRKTRITEWKINAGQSYRFILLQRMNSVAGIKLQEFALFLALIKTGGLFYSVSCISRKLTHISVREVARNTLTVRRSVKWRNRCVTHTVTSHYIVVILTWWHIIRIPWYCCHLVKRTLPLWSVIMGRNVIIM